MRAMGWWPFKRKPKVLDEDPHLRGTRIWIQDLREVCERHYDDYELGHQAVRDIRGEWLSARSNGEVDDALFEGLQLRAERLLESEGEQWLAWLDDEDFWNPGWREDSEEE
tara:strand:+ start:1250 stop:1582 length:333 start_codon:yes stop_codon:yes gene_type:complete